MELDEEFEKEVKEQILRRIKEAAASLKKANEIIKDNQKMLSSRNIGELRSVIDDLSYNNQNGLYGDELSNAINNLIMQIDVSGWNTSSFSC
jgi:hypothetical protein